MGLTETEAKAQGLDVEVHHTPDITGWYNYKRVRAEAAAFTVLVDTETGQIVGAHLVGEHADELINLFAPVIRHDLSARSLRRSIYAYPSHASDVPYML